MPITTGVRAIARDGAFADTATAGGPEGRYALALERPGRYDVRVEHSAYEPFTRLGVTVSADDCHVITVAVSAPLVGL